MLIDRENWRLHRRWAIATAIAAVAAIAWYATEATMARRLPDGASRPGLSLGVLGGFIILFEAFLWVRKKLRVWRIGRTQVWMRAHIWLGLLCLPFLVLHCGFRLGGLFTTVLMAVLVIVIVSGVWGLVMQQFLPSRMLQDVPAETIYSQIGYVSHQYYKEAEALVCTVCGRPEAEAAAADAEENAEPVSHLVVGAVRTVGRVQGKAVRTVAVAAVPESEPLWNVFESTIGPFLAGKAGPGSPLQTRQRAALIFDELRNRLDPAAHEAVNTLEELCEQRRQLQTQARLHFWLHNWLLIHLPLTAVLLIMMGVHVWLAVKYW
jgi:hypothetical protein